MSFIFLHWIEGGFGENVVIERATSRGVEGRSKGTSEILRFSICGWVGGSGVGYIRWGKSVRHDFRF